jgi:putative membrane protein
MSVSRPHTGVTPLAGVAALAGATVLAQITYPLLSGEPLRVSTIATVLLFGGASVSHAAVVLGPGAAARLVAVAGGMGLVAEAVGVRFGVPFGAYSYAGTLGPSVLGVPVIVPIAWTMMAYPCLLLGRRLARSLPDRIVGIVGATEAGGARVRRAAAVVLASWTLAAWDLYLDPQMVAAGHWSWEHPAPALPGVPGVPLTNYAGWLLVALVMTAALDRALPATDGGPPDDGGPRDESVPAALIAWTWLGSALGNLAFFGRPAVAAYGGLAMGLTVLPYLVGILRRLRERQEAGR